MSRKRQIALLVGDNPFHGISHLSQQRSRARNKMIEKAEYDASLVLTAFQNGANGFMFSVSEKTLSILKSVNEGMLDQGLKDLELYAIAPYAYDYVRMATQSGGMTGLATQVAKSILKSANVKAMLMGVHGLVTMDPESILKAYLFYEIERIRSAAGKRTVLSSILLHEIVTEMILALDLDGLAHSFINFMLKRHMIPGFETRNFALLVRKFQNWGLEFKQIVIATPFNKAGFQMNPSKLDCEKALVKAPEANIIAMSVLAAGYLRPSEAVEYLNTLENLRGIVVGVSNEQHAHDTFRFLKESLG
jgi:hypothetical protein